MRTRISSPAAIRETYLLAGNEVNRLLPALIDGNVGSVKVGSIVCIPHRI